MSDTGPLTAESVPDESAEPGWQISSLDELNRVLGRMARLDRLQSENERLVGAEVARLGEWLKRENEALAKRWRDLEAHVRVYAEAHREELGRYRNLPHGRVEWRRRKRGDYRLDPSMRPAERREALLAFAENAVKSVPEEICLTVSRDEPDLEAIKAFLLAHNDPEQPRLVPKGLEWVPPGETLSITTKESK